MKIESNNNQPSVHPGLEILAEWIADAFLEDIEKERESNLFYETDHSRDSRMTARNIPDEIYESE